MEGIYVCLVLYILFDLLCYCIVSKYNSSYFNSWTVNFATNMLVRLMPFIITVNRYYHMQRAVWTFILILFLSRAFELIGYIVGYRINTRKLECFFPVQPYSKRRYPIYLKLSILGMIISFLILAYRGGGIALWLFHTREAYITQRAGNGIWYILFELMILLIALLIICISSEKKKAIYLYAIPVIASYFTGSKGYFLGVIVLFFLYYDAFVKKIKFSHLVLLGSIGLAGLIVLLMVQSNISLLQYSDYYSRFLDYLHDTEGTGEFFYGKLSFEDTFWKMVPRALYKEKPFVYGQLRIVARYIPVSSIEAGNTPSFSQFILPYADFGFFGVAVHSFFLQYFRGILEKYFRKKSYKKEIYFNLFFCYCIINFLTPINLVIVYIIIIYIFLTFIQKVKLKDIKGKRIKFGKISLKLKMH